MRRPAIVIDARWLRSGIGRYTEGLLSGLKTKLSEYELRVITTEQHRQRLLPFCKQVLVAKSGIYSCAEQFEVPYLAKDAALIHSPHYNAPLLWNGKLVATIHDLNHLLHAEYSRSWKSKLYAQPMLRALVARAERIFTVSEFSKRLLVEHLGAEAEKIGVTGCAVAPAFQKLSRPEIERRLSGYAEVNRPYLLFVGDFRPNKNLTTLLKAVALLRARKKQCPLLVLAGGSQEGWKLVAPAMLHLGIENAVRWLPGTTDETLAALYCGAEMTVMPSLYEGFGLPVIESMSCGTPVICSNATSLPEVASGAALLFDPLSDEDLCEKIELLGSSPSLRAQLVAAGLQRAAQFTSARQAELHIEIYRSVLSA